MRSLNPISNTGKSFSSSVLDVVKTKKQERDDALAEMQKSYREDAATGALNEQINNLLLDPIRDLGSGSSTFKDSKNIATWAAKDFYSAKSAQQDLINKYDAEMAALKADNDIDMNSQAIKDLQKKYFYVDGKPLDVKNITSHAANMVANPFSIKENYNALKPEASKKIIKNSFANQEFSSAIDTLLSQDRYSSLYKNEKISNKGILAKTLMLGDQDLVKILGSSFDDDAKMEAVILKHINNNNGSVVGLEEGQEVTDFGSDLSDDQKASAIRSLFELYSDTSTATSSTEEYRASETQKTKASFDKEAQKAKYRKEEKAAERQFQKDLKANATARGLSGGLTKEQMQNRNDYIDLASILYNNKPEPTFEFKGRKFRNVSHNLSKSGQESDPDIMGNIIDSFEASKYRGSFESYLKKNIEEDKDKYESYEAILSVLNDPNIRNNKGVQDFINATRYFEFDKDFKERLKDLATEAKLDDIISENYNYIIYQDDDNDNKLYLNRKSESDNRVNIGNLMNVSFNDIIGEPYSLTNSEKDMPFADLILPSYTTEEVEDQSNAGQKGNNTDEGIFIDDVKPKK